MKLIDKYSLRSLFSPLGYCLAAFILIFIIHDLFDNLSDFIDAGTPILQVVMFYLFLMPSLISVITPISLLLATLSSLTQLAKNNELTAMRASGISLYRIVVPYIIVGFTATVIVALIHETVGPKSAYWTEQFVRQEKRKGTPENVHLAPNVALKNTQEGRIWMIGHFHTQTYDMHNVEVIEQWDDGLDKARYLAKKAQWLDDRWWFSDVTVQTYNEQGHPMGPPKILLRREMTEFDEEPKRFLNVIKEPEFLSSIELMEFLALHDGLSESTLRLYKTDLHNRLAMPWACFIVTLLGIPFGAHTARKGAFLGVALTIGLFFGYYVLINVGLAYAKGGFIPPWLGGWAPNITFLTLGLVLMYRMR